MYQLKLIYDHNGETCALEHEIYGCHITNSADFHNCELELPIAASQHYEKLNLQNVLVKNVVIIRDDEENAYESEYWNTIKRLHTYFADENTEHCNIELIHTEPELEQESVE